MRLPGANRDCFLLNPQATSTHHMNMFRFLGILMGIAIRTGSPLALSLAEPVWKQLAGELRWDDSYRIESCSSMILAFVNIHNSFGFL